MGSAGTNGFQMRRLAAVTANDDGGDGDGDGDGDYDNDGDCDSEDKGGDDGCCNDEGDVNTRYETKMMVKEEEEVVMVLKLMMSSNFQSRYCSFFEHHMSD